MKSVKKAAVAPLVLVLGGMTFEPRTMQISASKSDAAGTVGLTVYLDPTQAQAALDALKAQGALVQTRKSADNFRSQATYQVARDGKANEFRF